MRPDDGANWAGAVVAGDIALTNLAAAASPATVRFGTLDFAANFPIRVMKIGGAFTNDVVNIGTALRGDCGFEPVYGDMDELNRVGTCLTIGTCKKTGFPSGTPRRHAPKGWVLLGRPVAGDSEIVQMELRYAPVGLVTIFK